MGLYKKDGFVEHVPIELSRIISYFIQDSETNSKREKEDGNLAWLSPVYKNRE